MSEWRTPAGLRRLALRAALAALVVAFGAGMLYVSFRDATDPPAPVRTYVEVEQRLADLAKVAQRHLPGPPVRAFAYFTSTCPSKAAVRGHGLQGRAGAMEIELRRGDERVQTLNRMRDALRADGWRATFPSEVEPGFFEDTLTAVSPDDYHLGVDAEHHDTSVTVDLEAPCFRLPAR